MSSTVFLGKGCISLIFSFTQSPANLANHNKTKLLAHCSLPHLKSIMAKNCFTSKGISLEFRREVFYMLKIAAPTCLTYFTNFLFGLLTVSFVGHYMSTSELAGIALGVLSTNLTGFSFLVGFISAMETLLSQAYGSQQWKTYSLTTQVKPKKNAISQTPTPHNNTQKQYTASILRSLNLLHTHSNTLVFHGKYSINMSSTSHSIIKSRPFLSMLYGTQKNTTKSAFFYRREITRESASLSTVYIYICVLTVQV